MLYDIHTPKRPDFLDAPSHRWDSAEQLAFNAWASHCSLLDECVELLRHAPNPNDPEIQAEALESVGLDPDDLTAEDIEYLEVKFVPDVAERSIYGTL